jgi:tRNA(His) 5'-end guanylyltransferase
MSNSLGDRMKRYEEVTQLHLTRRVPVILRVDGRAFHTMTSRFFKKGYDPEFVRFMQSIAFETMRTLQGCQFCYGQSDEINFLLTDYRTISTDPHFNYDLQKIVSTSAATATMYAMAWFRDFGCVTGAVTFDARAFNIPLDDVNNYFLWRQRDATRNAISMWARKYLSHKECLNKSGDELQEVIFQKYEMNFNDLPTERKRGWCIVPSRVNEDMSFQQCDFDIPIFSQDHNYIEQFVYVRED